MHLLRKMLLLFCISLPLTAGIHSTGIRSSSYGIGYPSHQDIINACVNMCRYNKGAKPVQVWIVGITRGGSCRLEFPNTTGRDYSNVVFNNSIDDHEEILSRFDSLGIQVYLQVESQMADMEELIPLVLNRYKHHPSVIGFGVDVEWYRENLPENDGWGAQVTDSAARSWEESVKAVDSSYTLMLKHWDRAWMPPNYRGDILFLNDSQGFDNLEAMCREYLHWAKRFHPASVAYQIGYNHPIPDGEGGTNNDHSWWSTFSNPVETMSSAISETVHSVYPDLDVSIFWVDFTLRDPRTDLFRTPGNYPYALGRKNPDRRISENAGGLCIDTLRLHQLGESPYTLSCRDDRFEIRHDSILFLRENSFLDYEEDSCPTLTIDILQEQGFIVNSISISLNVFDVPPAVDLSAPPVQVFSQNQQTRNLDLSKFARGEQLTFAAHTIPEGFSCSLEGNNLTLQTEAS
ncbi:MAG: hypothetical protein ACQEQV_03345, partial [Fibrobacterota bacterium]